MSDFGTLNWIILIAYVIGNILLGFFLSSKVHTADDYYLGDRTTPWWVIGISVVATYIGALTFLGGPAWSYADGFSVIFIHINYPIAIFVVITIFLPFFYNSGVASIFDYLEKRFGLASRTIMSGVFLFGNIAYSGIMLYTTALVLEFITGVDVVTAIMIVAVVALTYTMLGGIAAVIWTDLIQTMILFTGAIITLVLLIGELPDGFFGTLQSLKEIGKTDPFEYSLDPSKVGTIWTGIVAMSIYHVVVYGVNQMMVQRTLTAKSLGDAKKAYIFMGYIAFFVLS
jgi:SSS family solute:Na+ symporter